MPLPTRRPSLALLATLLALAASPSSPPLRASPRASPPLAALPIQDSPDLSSDPPLDPGPIDGDAGGPDCDAAHLAYGRALEASRLCGTPQPFFVASNPACQPAAGGSRESRLELAGHDQAAALASLGPRGVTRLCAALRAQPSPDLDGSSPGAGQGEGE